MRTRLTREKYLKIAQRTRKMTRDEVAYKYGVSLHTVDNWRAQLRANGGDQPTAEAKRAKAAATHPKNQKALFAEFQEFQKADTAVDSDVTVPEAVQSTVMASDEVARAADALVEALRRQLMRHLLERLSADL